MIIHKYKPIGITADFTNYNFTIKMETKINKTMNGYAIFVTPSHVTSRLADVLFDKKFPVTEIRLNKEIGIGTIILANCNAAELFNETEIFTKLSSVR